MIDNKNTSGSLSDILTRLIKTLPNDTASTPLQHAASDNAEKTTGMEIQTKDGSWSHVDRATWRSWTGLRKLLGVPYHGPIFVFGSPEDAPPYKGFRECSCSKCQEHVDVAFKYN